MLERKGRTREQGFQGGGEEVGRSADERKRTTFIFACEFLVDQRTVQNITCKIVFNCNLVL